jgi:hypothetical protein
MKKTMSLKIEAEYEVEFDAELNSETELGWEVLRPKLLSPPKVSPEFVMTALRGEVSETTDGRSMVRSVTYDIFDELAEEAGEFVHLDNSQRRSKKPDREPIMCGAKNPELTCQDFYNWGHSTRRCPECVKKVDEMFEKVEQMEAEEKAARNG